MKYLKRLALATSLAIVLATNASADEINPPPCPNPGEINSPPCATQLPVGESNEASTIITEVELFILEATTGGIESLLTVF